MIASGSEKTLTMSDAGRVKETWALLVGQERFRNDYVVIWKPNQSFKKSDREGDF
jgi:hypothetical protein